MSDISINEIEIIFKLVIEKLKRDDLVNAEFNTDEYWIITADEWGNFKDIPKPVVGSIKEDVEYLKEAIEEKAIYSYNDFDRLATVLRAISQIQAPIS